MCWSVCFYMIFDIYSSCSLPAAGTIEDIVMCWLRAVHTQGQTDDGRYNIWKEKQQPTKEQNIKIPYFT